MQSTALAQSARPLALVRTVALIALGVMLLTLSAKMKVPFWPVPMTLQTLVVLGWGAFFGEIVGVGAVLGYLALGAAGYPVFAGTPEHGLGLAYMVGPTGGYLVGFLAAAWVVGRFGSGQSLARRALALLAGVVLIDGLGALWLTTLFPVADALAKGFGLFIVVDLIKAAIVAVGATAIAPLLAKLR